MGVHFLFSADGLRPTKVEREFADQAAALRELGASVSVVTDDAIAGHAALRNVPEGMTVIYRGWMLTPRDYTAFVEQIESAQASAFTSPAQYQATHHLPNWYSKISDLTPETVVLPPDADLVYELKQLGWDRFFIKDYVKSLKTTRGSIVDDPTEAEELAKLMVAYRGEIEGGYCVRRVEFFRLNSEKRYFVVRGMPYCSDVADTIPELVHEVVGRINSLFFSIDVVEREDGELRVVELGDGQVSDLVGWSPTRFASLWTDA